MANRNFPSQRIFGFNMAPVRVSGSISIGSTGAVSSFTAPGVASVTRLAAGKYQITLQDPYFSLLELHTFMTSVNATTPSGISKIEMISQSVSTAGGGTVIIQCLQAQVPASTTQGTAIQYAAADPASGSALNFDLMLNNSSVQ